MCHCLFSYSLWLGCFWFFILWEHSYECLQTNVFFFLRIFPWGIVPQVKFLGQKFWTILPFLHTAPALSRRPRQSGLPPYSLSVPTALTTSDFIIFIYFCSFDSHIIMPWSYLIPISFIASETGHTSMQIYCLLFLLRKLFISSDIFSRENRGLTLYIYIKPLHT